MISSKLSRIIIHIFLILCGVIWIYPFVWMVTSSLKSNQDLLISGVNPIPEEIHWDNYVRAWVNADFAGYFFNTVVMTLSTVIIVVLLCSLTGYALGRVDFPGRKIVMLAIVAVMFIPKGYTIIPLYELVKQLGLSDSLIGVIVAESSGAHVLFVLMFAAFFKGIPKELEEAAEIDGSGFVRTFIRVMLPLSKPIIATAVIMQFIWTWSSFLIPLVLTLNKPELRTLAVGMESFVNSHSTDWAGLAAGASISLVPVILVFIFMQRHFVEGIAGAVKQ